MELESTICLINGRYEVQLGLSGEPKNALTPVELLAFKQFGEPVIECGGTFTSGETTFTLPSNQRRFPSEFPIKQVFAIADNSSAGAFASLYQSSMETAIAAGRTAKTGLTPATTGRTVTTL